MNNTNTTTVLSDPYADAKRQYIESCKRNRSRELEATDEQQCNRAS